MTRTLCLRLASLLCLVMPFNVLGHEALRLQHNEQRQREQLERQQRLRQLERQQPEAPSESAPAPGADSRCWQVTGLQVAGNRLIDDASLRQRLMPLMQRCMTVAQINAVLRAINQAYVERGLIGSRPYLRTAPATGQPLQIVIVEGFLEAIELTDPGLPLSLGSAFPGLLGQPLQLRALEQGLDQLNRLRAFDLTASIEPGQLQGGSRVLIAPRSRPPRWTLAARQDDRGSAVTGRLRQQLSASIDSPAHLNDFLHLWATRAKAANSGYSQQWGLFYNVPYGPWSLGLTASQARYRAPLPGGRLGNEGITQVHGVSVERTLWRNGQGLLNGHVRLTAKSFASALSGLSLPVQRSRLSVVETGLSGLWIADGDGVWSASLFVAQGVGALGADPHAASAAHPQPRFNKVRGQLGHGRGGQVAGQAWRFNSQLDVQVSRDRLPALEQMLVTDHSAVRGFRQNAVSASNAMVWRNSLSLPRTLAAHLTLTPQLGFDMARATRDPQSGRHRLAGASVGSSLQWRAARATLEYQRALRNNRQDRLEPGFWSLELALTF